MNLIFRLLLILFRPVKSAPDITAACTMGFRVWPTDLDLNFHLTNSRYLALMDLGRIDFMRKKQLLRKVLKHKYQVVVESQEITYLKGAAPFSKVTLITQLIGWDNKYYYFRQQFVQDERIIAQGLMRGVFIKAGKVLDDASWVDLLSNQSGENMSEELRHWATQLQEQRQKAKERS